MSVQPEPEDALRNARHYLGLAETCLESQGLPAALCAVQEAIRELDAAIAAVEDARTQRVHARGEALEGQLADLRADVAAMDVAFIPRRIETVRQLGREAAARMDLDAQLYQSMHMLYLRRRQAGIALEQP